MKNSNIFKRIVKSHIFRIIIAAAVLFSTVFFPLYFSYPSLDAEKQNLLVIIVVSACVFEVIAFVLITHYLIYAKLNAAANRLEKLDNGEPCRKIVDEPTIDNTVDRMTDAVNDTADEFDRLGQMRKSFVYNASHELRSPLTSIQGFLQAVLDGTISDEDKTKFIDIALNETKRLGTLINSMLDLSRLDSGKNPITPSKFDINDEIREVVARFEPVLIKKALQINVDFSRDVCYVYADKAKIGQVLINLIDNAIKYSPSHSRIIVTTGLHDNKVYVTVRDYGYGISKKDQMLIWDSFYMSDKSHSPIKTKGSGLGLSIVKKIIDEHGEVIWVESSRGAGATFIFTLSLFDPLKHRSNGGTVIKMDKPIGDNSSSASTPPIDYTEN